MDRFGPLLARVALVCRLGEDKCVYFHTRKMDGERVSYQMHDIAAAKLDRRGWK